MEEEKDEEAQVAFVPLRAADSAPVERFAWQKRPCFH